MPHVYWTRDESYDREPRQSLFENEENQNSEFRFDLAFLFFDFFFFGSELIEAHAGAFFPVNFLHFFTLKLIVLPDVSVQEY